MKRSNTLRLTLMASALPLALTACDNPSINGQAALAEMERQNELARIERAAQASAAATPAVDCSSAELMQTKACKAELERLLTESPRFGTRDECLMATGNDCQQVHLDGQSAWIGPLVGFASGMILAEAIDEIGDAFERKRRYGSPYRERHRSGSYPSSGSRYPATTSRSSYPTASAPPPPPPTRAITQSRSGFGSTASARSSFGGFGG